MQRLCWIGVSVRRTWRAWLVTLALLVVAGSACATQTQPVHIGAGQSVVVLNGPWKFSTGDNIRWAGPDFDDSAWESVDLTAPPGAYDADVGLSDYVPGWGARGHPAYSGFGWYRLHVSVNAQDHRTLELLAPADVDDAYQVFFNDHLLAEAGDFAPVPPAVYSIQPRVIRLPPSLWWANGSDATGVIAFRVWMNASTARHDRSAGGLRVAPEIGTTDAVAARYRVQWMEAFWYDIVDALLATAFIVLAAMAFRLHVLNRADPLYSWLTVALALLSLSRANQAFFFWTQVESELQFAVSRSVLLDPMLLAAWTMTWRTAFGLHKGNRFPKLIGALTLAYMATSLFSRSFMQPMIPHPVVTDLKLAVTCLRWTMLLTNLYLVLRGARSRESWYVVPALLLVSIGLFARELNAMHIPGIWFPFGVGVSRTQFAFGAFDVAMFVLLLRRRSGLVRRDDRIRDEKPLGNGQPVARREPTSSTPK